MRNTYLLRKYGITNDDYLKLLEQQEGRCAVCKRPSSVFKVRLSVDHDHHSGAIRGLLCNYCNRRIVGRHRKDAGAELLKAAYDYLNREYLPSHIVPKRKKKKRGSKSHKKKSKRLRQLSRAAKNE